MRSLVYSFLASLLIPSWAFVPNNHWNGSVGSRSVHCRLPSVFSNDCTRQQQANSNTKLFVSEAIEEITMESEDRMQKTIDSVKLGLTGIRTGRASSNILDRVKVMYYGASTPLNQLASISVPSAQQLTVDPYDKSSIGDVEKAIVQADLGLTPSNDGSGVLRINIPPLTEDRRKELLKQCKGLGEEGKVALRNIRRDGVDSIKKVEKKGDVSEDEMKDGLDVMQKMTDKSVKEIDDIVSKKEKDVMTV